MSATQPPPYPGFQPYVTPGPAPYPQQSGVGPYPQQQGIGPYPQQSVGPYPQAHGGSYPQQPGVGPYPTASGPGPYPQAAFAPTGQYPYAPYSNSGPSPQQYSPDAQANYGPPPIHMAAAPADIEKDMPGWTGFTDKAIRSVFIRKVYGILMVQLLFTLGVIALFVFEPTVKRFVQRHIGYYYISFVIFFGVYIALLCCGNLRRKYPTNIILLSIFTMSMSYMLGTLSSVHDTKIVIMAVGICAGVCLTVSLFSFHSKFDFTSCGGLLSVLTIGLFIFGIVAMFTYHTILTTIYAGCGAVVFILFLAYDTQMLMGGKKYQLSPEEHIVATMQLYLDIVYIFTFLLMLLGGKNN